MARRRASSAKKYRALVTFYDKDGAVIKKGDLFDNEDQEYIDYLLGSENNTGSPVIEKK